MKEEEEAVRDVKPAELWMADRGWSPFDFQRETWAAYLRGESGLVHAATGTGKTMAVWWGPLLDWLNAHPERKKTNALEGLQVLWVTPMRALATDTERALAEVVSDLGIPWTVERRTGDTGSSAKARQLKRAPAALVTTPESLALMLSQENSQAYFSSLVAVVVDEWHELLGSKLGSLTELCLARLRAWRPQLRLWGLSATLGNLERGLSRARGRRQGGQAPSGPVDPRRHPEADRPRLDHPAGGRPLPLGRSPRPRHAAPGRGGDRGIAIDPGLHEHAQPGRELVPGNPRRTPRLGRPAGPPSRLAGRRDARLGGGWPARGPAASRCCHRQP